MRLDQADCQKTRDQREHRKPGTLFEDSVRDKPPAAVDITHSEINLSGDHIFTPFRFSMLSGSQYCDGVHHNIAITWTSSGGQLGAEGAVGTKRHTGTTTGGGYWTCSG